MKGRTSAGPGYHRRIPGAAPTRRWEDTAGNQLQLRSVDHTDKKFVLKYISYNDAGPPNLDVSRRSHAPAHAKLERSDSSLSPTNRRAMQDHQTDDKGRKRKRSERRTPMLDGQALEKQVRRQVRMVRQMLQNKSRTRREPSRHTMLQRKTARTTPMSLSSAMRPTRLSSARRPTRPTRLSSDETLVVDEAHVTIVGDEADVTLVGDEADDEAIVDDNEESGEDDRRGEAPGKCSAPPKKAGKRKLDAPTTQPSRSSPRKGRMSTGGAQNVRSKCS